jgi:hypothetical protein
MPKAVKIIVGVVLLVAAVFCFGRFRRDFSQVEMSRNELNESEPVAAVVTEPASNIVVGASTNLETVTNLVAASATNAVAEGTTESTNAAVPATAAPPGATQVGRRGDRQSGAFLWLGGFVICLLGVGVLAAWEIAHWTSRRAGDVLFADDAPDARDPEYDAAEAEWAKGNHLDAVRMMREYLDKNPSEQYVAIRIAEIYEKDLHNYLAAVLELEEVINKRLPAERWGWTAIHLANLYSGRLHQPEKAVGVLERIIREHPTTGAARKARERLGIPEETAEVAPSESAEAPPEPSSNLPRGFTPRKK